MAKKGFSRGFSKDLLFLLGGVIVVGILLFVLGYNVREGGYDKPKNWSAAKNAAEAAASAWKKIGSANPSIKGLAGTAYSAWTGAASAADKANAAAASTASASGVGLNNDEVVADQFAATAEAAAEAATTASLVATIAANSADIDASSATVASRAAATAASAAFKTASR